MKTKLIIIAMLCFFGSIEQMKAQSSNGPTLDETIAFIKMKTIGVFSYFTSDFGIEDQLDDDGRYQVFPKIQEIMNHNNCFEFKTTVENDKYLIKLYIDKVKSIEIVNNIGVKFTGDGSNNLYYLYYNDEILIDSKITEPNNIYFEYGHDDTPKMLKAWKHLCELKGIKLIGDLF